MFATYSHYQHCSRSTTTGTETIRRITGRPTVPAPDNDDDGDNEGIIVAPGSTPVCGGKEERGENVVCGLDTEELVSGRGREEEKEGKVEDEVGWVEGAGGVVVMRG